MWTLRRQAARAVVLDDQDRVLLIRAHDPYDGSKGVWWELPGGGVEGGESTADAAARELYEETGLVPEWMGPCVWTHHARYVFAGIQFDQQEHIHVARHRRPAPAGEYRPAGLEAIEATAFEGMRWWPLADVDEHLSGGGKVIPPWLAAELRRYLTDGPPGEPVDLGELGDVF